MQKTQYILHYKALKQVLWALFIGVRTIRMSKCNKIGPINLGDFSSIPKCFIGPAHFFIEFRLIVDIFINLYLVRIIWTVVHTLKLWKCIHEYHYFCDIRHGISDTYGVILSSFGMTCSKWRIWMLGTDLVWNDFKIFRMTCCMWQNLSFICTYSFTFF
jgi:hypothetical protein